MRKVFLVIKTDRYEGEENTWTTEQPVYAFLDEAKAKTIAEAFVPATVKELPLDTEIDYVAKYVKEVDDE